MKIFMIGASGYIGSVVAEKLMQNGHEITSLVRSEESAKILTEAGITPIQGAMGDVNVIAEAAGDADAVIQVATGGFLAQALETIDEATVTTDTILDALRGTDKPYIFTLGTGVWLDTGLIIPERVVTEADPMSPPHFYTHLLSIYRRIAAADDVRSIVLAPGQLYGRGGGYIGPVARVFNDVRKHGKVHAVANADNAFTFVHVDDLADLYVLALSNPNVSGLYIGATDTQKMVDVAAAVSRAVGLGGELDYVDHPTMRALNGRANEIDFWANCRASSEKAKAELGWRPRRPGLIEELSQLPKPLDLSSVYPNPSRQAAAAQVGA